MSATARQVTADAVALANRFHDLEARWALLREYVGSRIDTEHALMESFRGQPTGAASGAMVSALRGVLATMTEMEGP